MASPWGRTARFGSPRYTANNIGRITTTGTLPEFPVPTASSDPDGITAGPDGALWFTETAANKIGRMTTDGTFTEIAIPTAKSFPQGITTGPDGALWFTEVNGIDGASRRPIDHRIPTRFRQP